MMKDLLSFHLILAVGLTTTMFIACSGGNKQQQKPYFTTLPKTETVETKTEKAETKKENVETLGTWADDYTAGLLWQIVEKKNGIYILMANQKFHRELKKTIRDGNVIYVETNNWEEYYRILPDGNLAVFDNYGYIATYKKIK